MFDTARSTIAFCGKETIDRRAQDQPQPEKR
jgi:hypothetical protein